MLVADLEVDDFEVNAVRYRPESLRKLCEETKFNKHELQLMYRGFKQGCPNGIVTLQQFKDIYAQFFPAGGASGRYAQFVFNTFDRDHNGSINFEVTTT
jgi:Ca2+-binding EF-hand superfamily protein